MSVTSDGPSEDILSYTTHRCLTPCWGGGRQGTYRLGQTIKHRRSEWGDGASERHLVKRTRKTRKQNKYVEIRELLLYWGSVAFDASSWIKRWKILRKNTWSFHFIQRFSIWIIDFNVAESFLGFRARNDAVKNDYKCYFSPLLWKFVLTHSPHFLFCKDVTLLCTRGLFCHCRTPKKTPSWY